MELESLENTIRPLARRYCKDVNEIDDFEQVGRLTAWQVLEKNPDAPVPYVVQAIKNKFADLLTYKNRKCRNPGKRILSLDAVLGEGSGDDGASLLDFIGEESGVVLTEELMEEFREGLGKRFGKRYVKGLRDTGRSYKEEVCAITRAVIEGVHKIPGSDIPYKVNYKFFVDCGLQRFLWVFYRNSAFSAVMDAYPGVVVPWNFKRKPAGFWKGKEGYGRALRAIRWFADKHELEEESDCRRIGFDDFVEVGLNGMLQAVFNHSPYLALKTYFSDLKPWQTGRTSEGYFDNKKNQFEALSFYLMEKGFPSLMGLSPEEVYELGLRTAVTSDDMDRKGLRGLQARYKGNVYSMFCSLFPRKILPWTLHSSKEAWKDNPKKTGARAIKWLFDKYLKIPRREIPDYATCNLFWRVGFSGILTNRNIGYSSSPYQAVNSAYPGRFTREDFKRSRWEPTLKLNVKKLKKDRVK